MEKSMLAGLALMGALTIGNTVSAQAGTIFFDNFDGENGGSYVLNYGGFSKWTVSNGTVDLIGVGSPWNFFPGNGLNVDLDGSTGKAGLLQSTEIFSPGNYTLTFALGGNDRGYPDDTVTVTLGNWSKTFYNIPSNMPLTLYTENVSTDMTGSLSFHNGGGDNVGAVLDNVSVSAVPEPATMILFGTGLIGITGLVRRKKA